MLPGLGANAIGVEKEQIDDFRGGPTSDGVPISELNKMVPTPKQWILLEISGETQKCLAAKANKCWGYIMMQ